ncbi:glutaminase [Granulosicoccus antarcticus]|uniref:Glutaminase n=1 Tax=Granulosicoccus antarcticus IMCC3135 TaxID=1192854 RepID=A0A2Z2NUN4_9GAMM|nr:glutaminase [Granulosicoccus antarcticus]ASJ70804.1 Thermolabile glutaminase [Granulosicoccus antarcticus IMCC3135]
MTSGCTPIADDPDALVAKLTEIVDRLRVAPDRGKVADYIPELACIDPHQFGLSICLCDGTQMNFGDAETPFSIQSVSKAFTLAIALGRFGEGLWRRVGREPSSNAFNSVVDLELEKGKPRNPFVNAGAIVVTDEIMAGRAPRDALAEILWFVRTAAGDNAIYIDEALAKSEKVTGHRNWSLAHFLKSSGNLKHECDLSLGTYFHQCAIEMNCVQLARAGRFLAGLSAKDELVSTSHVRSINALMMTCGHYDGSGEFAYRVGFPGKSGVGGGIMAVVPGKASIAVWSPGLNEYGNSKLGTIALEELSLAAVWSVFSVN